MMSFSKPVLKVEAMIQAFCARVSNQHCIRALRGALLAVLACGVTTAGAREQIILEPSQDNSLYESPIDADETQFELSNGAGSFLFSGRTGVDAGFSRRRALMRFDLQSALPPGAQILAVELTVFQSKAAPGAPPVAMGVHRVLQEWGEAGSDAIGPEGQGDFAVAGDATWHHRIYPDTLWDTAGGQFAATPSAVTTIGVDIADHVWSCSSSLLDDVRFWQQNPAENFGWIIVGGEEAGSSAHRFNSRENTNIEQRPRLVVYYLPEETIFADGFEELFPCP